MTRSSILAFAAAVCMTPAAFADGHATPDNERRAACIADITEKSAAAGRPVNDAGAACDCLGAGVTANPALLEEIDAAGGLPPEAEASADLRALVESCMAADGA